MVPASCDPRALEALLPRNPAGPASAFLEDRAGTRSGNTVVLKPASHTPLTAIKLSELATDVLPLGVLNVITGSGDVIGSALVAHPKVGMISLTGDADTGKKIARVAATSSWPSSPTRSRT